MATAAAFDEYLTQQVHSQSRLKFLGSGFRVEALGFRLRVYGLGFLVCCRFHGEDISAINIILIILASRDQNYSANNNTLPHS